MDGHADLYPLMVYVVCCTLYSVVKYHLVVIESASDRLCLYIKLNHPKVQAGNHNVNIVYHVCTVLPDEQMFTTVLMFVFHLNSSSDDVTQCMSVNSVSISSNNG